MRTFKLLWIVLSVALVASLFPSGSAEASDGLCRALCERNFGRCLADAGCFYRTCRHPGACSGGVCSGGPDDGSSCGWAPGCPPPGCMSDRAECLPRCVDWSVELEVLNQLKLTPDVKDLLRQQVDQIRLVAEIGLTEMNQALGKELDTLHQTVRGLAKDKKIDEASLWTLEQAVLRVQQNLDSASLCRSPDQPLEQVQQERLALPVETVEEAHP